MKYNVAIVLVLFLFSPIYLAGQEKSKDQPEASTTVLAKGVEDQGSDDNRKILLWLLGEDKPINRCKGNCPIQLGQKNIKDLKNTAKQYALICDTNQECILAELRFCSDAQFKDLKLSKRGNGKCSDAETGMLRTKWKTPVKVCCESGDHNSSIDRNRKSKPKNSAGADRSTVENQIKNVKSK